MFLHAETPLSCVGSVFVGGGGYVAAFSVHVECRMVIILSYYSHVLICIYILKVCNK